MFSPVSYTHLSGEMVCPDVLEMLLVDAVVEHQQDQEAVLSIAKEYAAAVRKVMDATSIFLYGSYAKGTATKDSDIDIAVVVNQIPGDYLDAVSVLWKLTRSVSQEIEPVLLTPDDQKSGFLQVVQKTGIAV